MALISSSLLGNFFLCLTVLLVLIFFLTATSKTLIPSSSSPSFPNRSLLAESETETRRCSSLKPFTNGVIDYHSLHLCIFNQNLLLSVPSLLLLILVHFYILIKTAQTHFSTVTTKLASLLNLSPSMGAVTLLALGNGSPDVFASVAALSSGEYRTGFGAILSAGTFVSAFVVGFVAIYAAPFSVDAGSFVRDVMFYLIAATFLFYVFLSGEIFVWQAIGFVGFYVFFVGFVFWMDLGIKGGGERRREKRVAKDCEIGDIDESIEAEKQQNSGFCQICGMISKVWELPVSVLLKLTIPETSPFEWSRFYRSANIALCPLAILYSLNSLTPLDHPIFFLFPHNRFPLWLVVLISSFSLAILHFILEKEPPKTEQIPVVISAFVMSVFWISTTAGELLSCLEALGALLKLPGALLGLTVLAWGNSVGDLVADVAVAKAGHPAMAMAGCFAGPMFNMLVGLGTALIIQTLNVYPKPYELKFHVGIVMAFVFLLLSLMGSLLVVTWSRFRVPRFWGFCLVGLYAVFTIVSVTTTGFSR